MQKHIQVGLLFLTIPFFEGKIAVSLLTNLANLEHSHIVFIVLYKVPLFIGLRRYINDFRIYMYIHYTADNIGLQYCQKKIKILIAPFFHSICYIVDFQYFQSVIFLSKL